MSGDTKVQKVGNNSGMEQIPLAVSSHVGFFPNAFHHSLTPTPCHGKNEMGTKQKSLYPC